LIQVGVANGTEITPIGRWFGTVKVAGIGAPSWFEVFDSHGAFDIILGKPWLQRVKAIHDYETDQITITENGNTETISNTLDKPTPTVHTIQTPDETPSTQLNHKQTPSETPPLEQLDREWARIHQVRASPSPWEETRWAQYLTIDPMEDDEEPDTSPQDNPTPDEEEETPTPISEKERRRRHAEHIQNHRDMEGEALLAIAVQEYEDAREYERVNKPKAKRKKRIRNRD
jgi:hypothetical protein